MALANPVDLYAELSTACGCTPDVGGTWTITSAPLTPSFDLCTDINGAGFSTETVASLPYDLGGGSEEDIVIDFTGASCTPDDYSGEWVITYTVVNGVCETTSTATISVGGGTAEVTFERTPEICWYEKYSENPDTPLSKTGKFLMNVDYLTPSFSLRYKTVRKDFDNCQLSITTLDNTLESNIMDFTIADVPTASFHESFPTSPGFFLQHTVSIDTTGWVDNALIETFTVYDSAGGGTDIDLDLSAVTYLAGFQGLLASDLTNEIETQLLASGAVHGNAWFKVEGTNGVEGITITFICANNTSTWWGIKKGDWEVTYRASPGGPLQVNTFCTFSQDVQYNAPSLYSEYGVTNCDCYQNSTTCGIAVICFICVGEDGIPNSDANIYNLTSCDYDSLVLKASLPKVFDFDTVCAA